MDVTSKQRKKIVKYIIGDNFKKLWKYLKSEDISLNAVINKKGEKMVHKCAKEAATDCLELLIEKGAKANLVDKQGNLPLHLGIQYCIEQYSPSLEQNLVSLLLTHSSRYINTQNHQGVSSKQLLDDLAIIKTKTKNRLQPNISDDDESRWPPTGKNYADESDDQDGRAYSDKEWRAKLEYECDYEFQTNMGRFEEDADTCFYSPNTESYDQWADRIYSAFSARRKRTYAAPQSSHSSGADRAESSNSDGGKKKRSLKPEMASQQRIREKIRERRQREELSAMYAKLFESGELVGVEDIPYTGITPPQIIDLMIERAETKEKEAVKKVIREELRRWHPDKFKQKIGGRIKEGEEQLILDKVKTIAQALTTFAK